MATTLYRLLILFILLTTVLAFLLTTTPGLYASFKLANLFLPGKIQLEKASGSLMKQFSFKTLTYTNDAQQIQLKRGSILWQLPTAWHRQLTITKMTINHVFINHQEKKSTNKKPPATPAQLKTITLPIQLQINELTLNRLELQKNGHTERFNQLSLQAALMKTGWSIKKLSLQTHQHQITLIGQGDLNTPYRLSTSLTVFPLRHQPGINGHLDLKGDYRLLHWRGQFNGLAHTKLSGTLKNRVEIQAELDWNRITWPINTTTELKSRQGHLAVSGNWFDLIINAQASIQSPVIADWQLSARIKDQKTTMKSTLNLPKGDLQTTLMANASLSSPQQGQLSLAIQPGIYQLPPNSPLPNLPFKGGNLSASLTPDALALKGFFILDTNKKIDINLRLPGFSLKHISDTTQPMTGTIKAHVNSLEFLQALSKNIEQPQGELTMSLLLKGAMMKPTITGELSLKKASVTLPNVGLKLNPIQVLLTSNNNHWEALGNITAEEHTLNLKGTGRFYPEMLGELSLQADHFPLIKTAQNNINLSPKLILRLTPGTLDISGDVLVPSAQLKLQSFRDSINLSDDVVFVRNPTLPLPINITTNVQLTMGENVALDVKGLHGRLDGSLRISKLPTSTVTAGGELHIMEGKYRAYGQDLAIEQGQLLFTGGPIDNPGLNIRATRSFKNTGSGFSPSNQPFAFNTSNIDAIGIGDKTTVGINITGRINAPKIKLFSIPSSLSQSDILSMLILGKPVSQANKAGGQLLLAAVSSMNLDSGTKGMQLMDQLQHTLGLDFDIQNNTIFNQKTNQASDNTSLVVGKSFGKRVYLSYNIGLLQTDSNVLTLKYLLNKYFNIQVNASDSASGIDLLYTHSK